MPVNANPEEHGLCPRRLGRIRSWMRAYVDAGKLPGMLTLVARGGKIVFLDVYGDRDVQRRRPLSEDTIFRIYSMTKPITSVAVMQLYEHGRFQLDDPVSAFLPELTDLRVYVSGQGTDMRTEPLHEPVTIHHLLTHTSGLTYGFSNDNPLAAAYKAGRADFATHDGPLEEVVGRLCSIPLLFQPGTRWGYGVSTDVLGRLVEVISGKRFDRFVEESVLAPLGMSDTGFQVSSGASERLAALYAANDEDGLTLLESPGESAFVGNVTTFSGGAGLVSTVGDYFRFTEMLRRRGDLDGTRLLGRKTVEYMTRNHLPGDLADMGQATFNETSFSGIGFGLGFAVMLDSAKANILGSEGEYGWGGWASTAFWIDPLEDLTVILLTQLAPSSKYPLRRELRVLTYQTLIN